LTEAFLFPREETTMRSYYDLKRILELWEAGHNKLQISKITGIPRVTISNCIERYGSLANLEALMRGQPLDLPAKDNQDHEPRRYIIPGHIPTKRGHTDDEVAEAIADSYSLAEVLRRLNLRPAGGNYAILRHRIRELGLDTSHFTGKGWSKGKKKNFTLSRSLDEILVKDSTYTSTHKLRQRLIAEGIFAHECVSCGLTEWLERPIPLEIDHVNGDRRDNRLENLRLLCPNCHALTATYRGKNKGGRSSL
jgi:hypothetical protein